MFPTDVKIEAVVFKTPKTVVPGVRTEYYIYETGVKFHIWKDPDFPEHLESSIKEAWSQFPKESVIVDYVPEVDSWYAELKNINIGISDVLVESLVKKVAKAVSKHG